MLCVVLCFISPKAFECVHILANAFIMHIWAESRMHHLFDDMLLNDLLQLSDNSIELTEDPLTLAKTTATFKTLKKAKSPGSDGLTNEFYQFFWSDITPLVLQSLVHAYDDTLVSFKQRRAVIRLISKKDKDITDLQKLATNVTVEH